MPTKKELEEELERLKNNDLTILMPTYNGSDTIQIAIKSTLNQGVKSKIIIMDHGSIDGTFEMLTKSKENGYYGDLDIEILQLERKSDDPKINKCDIRTELGKLPTTKYTFWLDDDIKLPSYSLRKILDDMIRDPKIGMHAIIYQHQSSPDPKQQHYGIGATMMPTKILKDIRWECGMLSCECQNTRIQIEKMGLKTGNLTGVTAINLSTI